jgi:hypothetical protein
MAKPASPIRRRAHIRSLRVSESTDTNSLPCNNGAYTASTSGRYTSGNVQQ